MISTFGDRPVTFGDRPDTFDDRPVTFVDRFSFLDRNGPKPYSISLWDYYNLDLSIVMITCIFDECDDLQHSIDVDIIDVHCLIS